MEFQILGTMEVVDGSRRVPLPAGRGRALLALLVLHAGDAVPAERLIDELWGEHPPATASTVVQGLVSRLRTLLEPGRDKGEPPAVLQTVGNGYRLAVDPQAVDANRFKRMLDQGRGADPVARSQLLGDALGLWRGPALADFTYEPFAQRAIAALEELRLAAIEDRIDVDLALGRHRERVAEVDQLVSAHPFRERLRGQLMLALYRAGRQADALEAYRKTREALVEELGIEPGRGLRELEGAILRQDPSLDLPARTPESADSVREPEPVVSADVPWLPRERRTVTVVVADLTVSSDSELDPEALSRFTTRAADVGAEVLRGHGARVEEGVGGSLLGLFGLPVAHEDDALRAVRAAAELPAAADRLSADSQTVGSPRFSARAGIDTGEVVVGPARGSARTGVSGPVITDAARLHQVAAQGDVLVGASTQRLVRGDVVLKRVEDSAAPGTRSGAWRFLSLVPGAQAGAQRPDSPMFGRQPELSRLRASFRRTVRSGHASRFTVLGEAGIGKTRLAREFSESIGSDAWVISGRCPAYGEGITFLPLREALLEAAGPPGWPALATLLEADEDGGQPAAQIAAAIGLMPPQGTAAALFPAVRRLFEKLAANQPLVVVFEDVHWAETTLVDLIEYVARSASGPIFLLCLARPELLDEGLEPADASPDTLVLEPLSEVHIEELVGERTGGTSDPATVRRIVQTARGNPLFAEQLLAALADDGVDVVPPSLGSLLAMRLDRLGRGERDLLRSAAVIGTECGEDALVALLPEEAHPFVERHLATLERRRLIERTDETALRFGHVLIQLAAYQSMTREDRARLHERYAAWLEAAGSAPPELDEIVGYHLEQVVEHRRASGVVDAALPALAARAGDRLANAADRAFARYDVAAVENLLSRARRLLPEEHPRRLVVTQRLAEVDLVLGRHREAQALLDEVIALTRAAGDLASERLARLERARSQFTIGPDPVSLAAIRREADEAAAFFAEAGDDTGWSNALFLTGLVLALKGRVVAAEKVYRDGMTFADRSGRVREELAYRWMLAETVAIGPTPVRDCIAACEQLATTRGAEHPGVMTELATLLAMEGRFDEAREMNERARRILAERMHVRRLLRWVSHSNAKVELLAGRPAAAERELRIVVESVRETGEREQLAQASARLATALRSQGRAEEAADFAALSLRAAPREAVAAQALSHGAGALAAADAGDQAEAARLAREAVGWAPDEMPNLRADVLAEFAEVCRAGGREEAASQAVSEAARLYERKGNAVSAARILGHRPREGTGI
jgi:DNA-binding SARP family transcriptional activator/tetratricopeptide (TPR) repeat protein